MLCIKFYYNHKSRRFLAMFRTIVQKTLHLFTDLYHRCLQRRFRSGDMVELLRVICDHCYGHVLSVVFFEHMIYWEKMSGRYIAQSSLIHRSAIHYYSIAH